MASPSTSSNAENTGDVLTHILTLSCAEQPGIVHAVTEFLLEHSGDILELKQFDDPRAHHFFMRIHFASPMGGLSSEALSIKFSSVAHRFSMDWQLRSGSGRARVLVMVSKFEHCLNDLMFRERIGDLPIQIVAVVSNHEDLRGIVEWHGIPYFHLPVTAESKPRAEEALLVIASEHRAELIVLARYMQVLSPELTHRLSGRAINIHHSFLPSFKGAKPYHQAYERGVKTVGATAHYVDDRLDEGPIISQQVVAVDHTYGPDELVAAGRDTECKALSDAVRWHAEGRILLHKGRTVVLR